MRFYSRFLENCLLPIHDRVRGRKYVNLRKFLEQSQWWPQEKLIEFQWSELQRLLQVAFESVPYYREKYGAVGARLEDIRSWEDFRRLPMLTREEVAHHREELSASTYKGALLSHATGGSSGVPVRFYRTIESYDWRTAATQRVYSWSGCHLGERSLYFWGAPVGKQALTTRVKVNLHEAMNRQRILPTFAQDEALWNHAYKEAQRFRPRFLVGYVSSLVQFARHVETHHLDPPHVAAIVAAAEPLEERTRVYLEQVLQAPVFNTYGSREFMSIGGECERREGLHINAENLVVEAVCGASAEAADLLITDLHNLGTVFIRYAIGDLGLLSDRTCSCGRGLPMLGSVQGRALDTLKLYDGRTVSCIFFRHILKDIPEILEYQVEQVSLQSVVISVVVRCPISQRARELFHSEMKKVLGTTKVELRVVPEIPKGISGKCRTIIALQ